MTCEGVLFTFVDTVGAKTIDNIFIKNNLQLSFSTQFQKLPGKTTVFGVRNGSSKLFE